MWTNIEGFRAELRKWRDYNYELLQTLFTTKGPADEFRRAGFPTHMATSEADGIRLSLEAVARQVVTLESVLERLSLYQEGNGLNATGSSDARVIPRMLDMSTVFIVHGHDTAARHGIARFVERFGLTAIVLDEQPNKGNTIIEKLAANSDVAFAIVLLTGDDVGASKEETVRRLRARQNVILELGYFIGKLGRECVCALYEDGVELPSDYHGVGYIPLDKQEAWKLRLAKEMKAAGLSVDLNRAI